MTYEVVISGDVYSALTFRTLRFPLYTECEPIDLSVPGTVLGNVGITTPAQAEVEVENASELGTEWSFSLDEVKLSVNGSYSTQADAAELAPAYLVLKSAEETKVYDLTQFGAAAEEGTNVTVSGWVSPVGLEGTLWDLYVVVEGTAAKAALPVQF